MSNISDAAPARAPLTTGEAARLNNRMFARLMPLLVAGYVLNFLDRTNIALAKTALQTHVGITPAAYGLGAGLFFLAYSACEVPSNLILQKVGARVWITRIMATWGVASMAMALVHGTTSFYVLRILLGVAEAGLFPGIIYYLTRWFGPREQARAISYFLLGVSLANVIGGPLGGALLGLDGKLGLAGWQWLFILEGAPAVLFSLLVWTKLPEGPASAPWLTPAESAAVLARIKADRDSVTGGGRGERSLKRAFLHPQVLLAIFVYFCHQIALYSLTFFLPGIIRSWGALSELQIGALAGLPWVAAAIGAATLPGIAARGGWMRGLMIAGLFILAGSLLGPVWLAPGLALGSLCIGAALFSPVQSVVFTYPSARFEGPALAAGLGFLNCLGITGGFIGPYAMGLVEQATGKATNGLWLVSAALAAAGVASAWLRHPAEDRS